MVIEGDLGPCSMAQKMLSSSLSMEQVTVTLEHQEVPAQELLDVQERSGARLELLSKEGSRGPCISGTLEQVLEAQRLLVSREAPAKRRRVEAREKEHASTHDLYVYIHEL